MYDLGQLWPGHRHGWKACRAPEPDEGAVAYWHSQLFLWLSPWLTEPVWGDASAKESSRTLLNRGCSLCSVIFWSPRLLFIPQLVGDTKTGGEGMKLSKVKSAVVGFGMTAAVVAVPLVTAGPAQADQIRCASYLKDKGYIVGAGVRQACERGSASDLGTRALCQPSLFTLGISNAHHRAVACRRAAD